MNHTASVSLLTFLLGYAAVLAVPGPNILAVGSLAALRGFYAAVPFGVGAAVGATALAGLTLAAIGAVSDSNWGLGIRVLGATLLILVALRIACPRPGPATRGLSLNMPLLDFASGCCTAVSNPITAAYFLGVFAGSSQTSPEYSATALLVAVSALSATFYVGASALIAIPSIRGAVLARERSMRLVTASVLVLLALSVAWQVGGKLAGTISTDY